MNSKTTPVRRQYLSVKEEYPNCIVLFRLGDFYEMFDDDAQTAARELDIALTHRSYGKSASKTPMAGVPYHAVDNYITKLIEKGYHVVICDQVGEVTGRGPVKREVTRVITPGTVIEPTILAENQSNYLMALLPFGKARTSQWQHAGIAYAEISTGEFAATQFSDTHAPVLVLEEIVRLHPREIIIPQSWSQHQSVTFPEEIHCSVVEDWYFDQDMAVNMLCDHFQVYSLEGLGLSDKPYAIGAAGAILNYLHNTQKSKITQLTTIHVYSTDTFMVLDPFTRRNLELTQTIRDRKTRGSLLAILDNTTTAMGARLLRKWMSQPLLEQERLDNRLNATEALIENTTTREELRNIFHEVNDLERLINRLSLGKAMPRDLLALRDSLVYVPELMQLIQTIPALTSLLSQLDPCAEVVQEIHRALTDDPPSVLNSTGIIRPSYCQELDHVIEQSQHARDWIANLEHGERQRTGIDKLKVSYNRVFGYYIEVSKHHLDKVPDDYIRKQTTVNHERYVTPEMKEYEAIVLNAEEVMLQIEREVFHQLCQTLAQHSEQILKTARAIAHLDVLVSFAYVAVRHNYVRPTFAEDDCLIIHAGRHPVVETMTRDEAQYVPNDTAFDADTRIHIITGPNMAGKSTYIRQVALIVFMAQIGSFVPADKAIVGLTDRIFARIGAQDEIHSGHSTFMVEMIETARLLTSSSSRSLLILDEIGRGTSTYDGLAIARAVVEYIHNNPELNCRTLFATHYHELLVLADILPRVHNFNVIVQEAGDSVIFLHRVLSGGADQSYGVHVAQIAGMPRAVIARAKELLYDLEHSDPDPLKPVTDPDTDADKQYSFSDLNEGELNPAIQMLRDLDVNNLSPIEALTKLYQLKGLVD